MTRTPHTAEAWQGFRSSEICIDVLYNVYVTIIQIFKTSIPMSVRAAETPAVDVSIYKHDAKGKVALAYEELPEEKL